QSLARHRHQQLAPPAPRRLRRGHLGQGGGRLCWPAAALTLPHRLDALAVDSENHPRAAEAVTAPFSFKGEGSGMRGGELRRERIDQCTSGLVQPGFGRYFPHPAAKLRREGKNTMAKKNTAKNGNGGNLGFE